VLLPPVIVVAVTPNVALIEWYVWLVLLAWPTLVLFPLAVLARRHLLVLVREVSEHFCKWNSTPCCRHGHRKSRTRSKRTKSQTTAGTDRLSDRPLQSKQKQWMLMVMMIGEN
jgi:hypothetical protein